MKYRFAVVPKFYGGRGDLEAWGWLIELDKFFQVEGVKEDQKYIEAVKGLRGNAYDWYRDWKWSNLTSSWRNFEKALIEKYLPDLQVVDAATVEEEIEKEIQDEEQPDKKDEKEKEKTEVQEQQQQQTVAGASMAVINAEEEIENEEQLEKKEEKEEKDEEEEGENVKQMEKKKEKGIEIEEEGEETKKEEEEKREEERRDHLTLKMQRRREKGGAEWVLQKKLGQLIDLMGQAQRKWVWEEKSMGFIQSIKYQGPKLLMIKIEKWVLKEIMGQENSKTHEPKSEDILLNGPIPQNDDQTGTMDCEYGHGVNETPPTKGSTAALHEKEGNRISRANRGALLSWCFLKRGSDSFSTSIITWSTCFQQWDPGGKSSYIIYPFSSP